MKKILLLLPGILIFFAACGGGKDYAYPELRALAPKAALSLCDAKKEVSMVTPDGYESVFRGPATMIESCFTNTLWRVSENPDLPEAALFYFNKDGRLVDICQPATRSKPCEKFGGLTCIEANLCL